MNIKRSEKLISIAEASITIKHVLIQIHPLGSIIFTGLMAEVVKTADIND